MERWPNLKEKVIQMALDHKWPGKWKLNYTFPRIFKEGEISAFRDFLAQPPTKTRRRDIMSELVQELPPDYLITTERLQRSLMVKIQDIPYEGKRLTVLTFEGENATKRRAIYQEKFLETETDQHILTLRNLLTVWDRVERIQKVRATQNLLLVIGRSLGDMDGTVEFYDLKELRQLAIEAHEHGIQPRPLK